MLSVHPESSMIFEIGKLRFGIKQFFTTGIHFKAKKGGTTTFGTDQLDVVLTESQSLCYCTFVIY